MRILVTGASGMLGSTLAIELSRNHKVFGTGNSDITLPIDYRVFDLSNESYKELIDWSQPELIIHCAAITNGNYCQENCLKAINVNGVSVHKILNATNTTTKIIYISTDAVFSSSSHMAKEVHSVFPENIYGKSKELGEFFLNNSQDRQYTIIRTTIVGLNINKNRIGFVEWIINTAKENKKLGLFTDVLFTPISIWDLVDEINFLINTDNINSETIHIGGELCTKYEFGYRLLDKLNISTKTLSKTLISSYKDRAKRSNDQSLDSSYYSEKYQRKLVTLDQTILKLKAHYEFN
jgi:dTDP-4-dehydrorhamnose reductase